METSRMNVSKLLLVSFVTVLMISVIPVFAENGPVPLGMQVKGPKVEIHKLFLVGNGVAIDQNDLSNFKIVKIGIAKVNVALNEEVKTLNAGLIYLDKDKYRVKNIAISNGTFTADIYTNNTKVGSIDANSVIKVGREVWYGKIVVDEKTYNLYILDIPRHFRASEIASNIGAYCKENPDDEKCKMVSTYVGKGKEKIENYCSAHPNDSRCKALEKVYCLKNLDDDRCRYIFEEKCKENPDNEECMALKKRQMIQYCKKNPLDSECVKIARDRIKDYCINNPDDKKCKNPIITKKVKSAMKIKKYCAENPTDEKCIVFCNEHPAICKNVGALNNTRQQNENGNVTLNEDNEVNNNERNNENNHNENNQTVNNKGE